MDIFVTGPLDLATEFPGETAIARSPILFGAGTLRGEKKKKRGRRRKKKACALFIAVASAFGIRTAFVCDVTPANAISCFLCDGLQLDGVARISSSSDTVVLANTPFNGAFAVTEYAVDVR